MAGFGKAVVADVRGTFTRTNLVQNLVVAAVTLLVSPVFHFYAKLDWPSLVPALVGLFVLASVGVHSLRSDPEALELTRRPIEQGPALAVSLPGEPCNRYPFVQGGWCVYCHLQVTSLGDEVLTRCRARLMDVAQTQNGVYVSDERFTRALRLKWANALEEDADAEYREIEPDQPALLDVLWTAEKHPGYAYIATLDSGPRGVPTQLGPGFYRLTVRVSAEGHASADFTFHASIVDHGGTFGTIVTLQPYSGPPVKFGSGQSGTLGTIRSGPSGPQGPMSPGAGATGYTGPMAAPGTPTGSTGPSLTPKPPRVVTDVAKALQAWDEGQRRSFPQRVSHGPGEAREVVMEDRVELSVGAGSAMLPRKATCEVTTPSGTTYRVEGVHRTAEPSMGAIAQVAGPLKAVAIFPDSFPNAPDELDPGRYEVIWEIAARHEGMVPTEVRREFTIH